MLPSVLVSALLTGPDVVHTVCPDHPLCHAVAAKLGPIRGIGLGVLAAAGVSNKASTLEPVVDGGRVRRRGKCGHADAGGEQGGQHDDRRSCFSATVHPGLPSQKNVEVCQQVRDHFGSLRQFRPIQVAPIALGACGDGID
jgi:hypothetical protein